MYPAEIFYLSGHNIKNFVHSTLQHCFSSLKFVDIHLCMHLCLRSHHNISIMRSGPICCRVVGVFRIIDHTAWPSWPHDMLTSRVLLYRKEFMVKSFTAKCPTTVAARQSQIISPPLLCLTAGMRFFYHMQTNISNIVLCIMVKHLHFVLFCPKYIV